MENFGKIKNAYNSLLADSIGKKDAASRDLFKQYVKTIKESEILRSQFLIYNNIEGKLEKDQTAALHYVSENIDVLRKFKVTDIIKENSKLLALTKDVKLEDGYTNSELHESLAKLICTPKTPRTIDTLINETQKVARYIQNNEPKVVTESVDVSELPSSMFANIMVDKFNERYTDLNESERKVLKALMENNNTQIQKEVYQDLATECISLINETLKDADTETKDQLLQVKEKLLNDKESLQENEYIANITKLLELKETLSNN